MEKAEIREKIDVAKRRLAEAEKAMQTALQALEPSVPSDKTMISNVLRIAFGELRAAKEGVLDLERLITSGK
jgi:hypothetical protein